MHLTCHDLYRLYPKWVGVDLADGIDGVSRSVEALEPEIKTAAFFLSSGIFGASARSSTPPGVRTS